MKAEETISCVYWSSGLHPALEIHLHIQVEIPGEEGGDVATSLVFEPPFPAYVFDRLSRSVYDGVHEGIAAAETPLPPGGMSVKILQLQLLPLPDPDATEEELRNLGQILYVIIRETVAALWTGLIHLSGTDQNDTACPS